MSIPYVTYFWYQAEYLGERIPEDAFVKLENRSRDYLELITLKRTKNIMTAQTDTEAMTSIRKAMCAVMEVMYDHAEKVAQIIAADAAMAESNVESESVGKHSIHYAKASSPGTRRALEKEMRYQMLEAARMYLTLHNLLYVGVWQ